MLPHVMRMSYPPSRRRPLPPSGSLPHGLPPVVAHSYAELPRVSLNKSLAKRLHFQQSLSWHLPEVALRDCFDYSPFSRSSSHGHNCLNLLYGPDDLITLTIISPTGLLASHILGNLLFFLIEVVILLASHLDHHPAMSFQTQAHCLPKRVLLLPLSDDLQELVRSYTGLHKIPLP
ncbi:hypothetical protein L1987_09230 [Smallanthus sonchifolius]|uniref:Uncharacterized protein n=1 Tax=Smallanthus sonchifolius TaxID=185202 RepID=A0ACB9JNF2_9ASTR|nr:hypothetical protein L1987_09230 [Smallanthus sonchifolius]